MLYSILLTTDFSDLSRKPFGAAAALAKKFNARLFLIHLAEVARSWARAYGASVRLLTVVEPCLNLYGDSILTEEDLAIPNQKLEARAVSRLEQLIQAEWKGVQAQARVRLGHPAQEILEEIGEFRPDLVIMASRGLSLDPIPLGSVTERTIHEAPCPVLVVKL